MLVSQRELFKRRRFVIFHNAAKRRH